MVQATKNIDHSYVSKVPIKNAVLHIEYNTGVYNIMLQ